MQNNCVNIMVWFSRSSKSCKPIFERMVSIDVLTRADSLVQSLRDLFGAQCVIHFEVGENVK